MRLSHLSVPALLVTALVLFCLGPVSLHADAQEPGASAFDPAVLTDGFLAAHPDLRWRSEGLQAFEEERFEAAFGHFRLAAKYADKPSQAMLAEMLWDGIGVEQDRPLAYAWMDLAAERLYPAFIARREGYWRMLDAAQRRDAIARGEAVYLEYGDDVAKPRLERVLQRERRRTTGSRAGFVGNLTIIPNTGPMAGTGLTISGDQYYAPKYWEPRQYWLLQDEIWNAPKRERVDVGDLVPVEPDQPPEE
jgi:TPR repeat protein